MKPANNIEESLRWLFSVYIKSSLHVGLAVTCFSLVTVFEYGLQTSPVLLPFVFCSTVTAYNFTKYLSLFNRRHLAITAKLKAIAVVTLLSFVYTIFGLFYLDFSTLCFAAIPALLTAAYGLPVFRNRTNLRHVYGAKLFVIGAVWALVTVGLPFAGHFGAYPPFSEILIEGIQRLLFVMVLTLPFDIRDVHTDTDQLGTIPQVFGIRATRSIGIIALITVLLIELFQIDMFNPGFAVFLFMILCTALLIHKSMTVRSAYFASFWVEGIPIAWAVLLFFLV